MRYCSAAYTIVVTLEYSLCRGRHLYSQFFSYRLPLSPELSGSAGFDKALRWPHELQLDRIS